MGAINGNPQSESVGLKRSLRFRDLVLYGIILIQPTAPMPSFGVIYQEARGHVVTAILPAMVAMLFTSVSYGRMTKAYPHDGSAFNFLPSVPYVVFAVFFALFFTALNLNGVEVSARINAGMAAALGIVIVMVLAAAAKWLLHLAHPDAAFFMHPFYYRSTFSPGTLLRGTSIAVLT